MEYNLIFFLGTLKAINKGREKKLLGRFQWESVEG
jgi:hypothetical protein